MKIKPKTHWRRTDGAVHGSFGLSRAAYMVVPRLALQAMPVWWQKIFIWLCDMLPSTPEYVCQRRDENGRFIKDPWVDYKYGDVEKLLAEDRKDDKPQWKIIAVENVKHNNR